MLEIFCSRTKDTKKNSSPPLQEKEKNKQKSLREERNSIPRDKEEETRSRFDRKIEKLLAKKKKKKKKQMEKRGKTTKGKGEDRVRRKSESIKHPYAQ